MQLEWDRGTIVLRGGGRGLDLRAAIWDTRISAWRAPGSALQAWKQELACRALRTLDAVPPPLPLPDVLNEPELRPYQAAALLAWEGAGRRGLIALPTGAGKTRTAIAAIARAKVSALCIVPTRVLLEQWRAVLSAAGAAEVGCFGDGKNELRSLTVATQASALHHVEALGSRFELLIADEAHQVGSAQAGEFLEMYTAPFRLGLTATPPEDPASLQRLEQRIGPLVYRCSIEELAGRFLSPFRIATLRLSLSLEERAAYEAEANLWRPVIHRFFEFAPGATWVDFVRASASSEEGRRALRAWRSSRERLRYPEAKRATVNALLAQHARSRALVFAGDARTACEIARDELIPVITADIGRAERASVLERFARGELRAIASARVLNEGVDVPAADVAILVAGSLGKREVVQRIGRVLRPAEGKEAWIYELVTRGTFEVPQAERARKG